MFLKKENSKDHRNWKVLPCFWIGRINIVKIAILQKENHSFNAISNTIPGTFFTEMKNNTLIFIWNNKGLLMVKVILRK